MRGMARRIEAADIVNRVLQTHHLTQAEFANLAGVTVATVNRWSRGHQLADARTIANAITLLNDDPAQYGLEMRAANASNDQLLAAMDALREEQRRQHDELLAALSEIRTGIEVIRQRP